MNKSIVRHILLGKFRPEITIAQRDEIFRRFREMTEKIPGILSFEHGANNSTEGSDLGMTDVILVTFADKAARDAYLVHPEHTRFITWLGELNLIQDLVIVDFTPHS